MFFKRGIKFLIGYFAGFKTGEEWIGVRLGKHLLKMNNAHLLKGGDRKLVIQVEQYSTQIEYDIFCCRHNGYDDWAEVRDFMVGNNGAAIYTINPTH